MDRQMVYPGAIPLDTDLLLIQRHAMTGLGMLARCVLGSAWVADGLVCVPAGGLALSVGPGSLAGLLSVDATAFGSLPADPRPLMRLAMNPDAVPLTLAPPPAGAMQAWLIQATITEADAGPLALPYYNAGNPAVAWSGPLNSGQAQATQRILRVSFSLKPGLPVLDANPVLASADSGWVGLYGVTVRDGQATILAADIAALPTAPFLSYRLPELTPGFTRQEVLSTSTTWRAPAGVRRARVRLVGAGGGGGGGDTAFGGGGGGAGGYAEAVITTEPGATLPVSVGAGGAGAGPLRTGEPGGYSSVATLVTATGGTGGGSSNPDSRGGAGGFGRAGSLLLAGGYGADGPRVADVPAGAGGASALGGGGRGAFLGGPPAQGQAPGSGGGGAYGANSLGGTGAAGLVIIEY